jgi:ATP-dependent protease Clp ATPase subunit
MCQRRAAARAPAASSCRYAAACAASCSYACSHCLLFRLVDRGLHVLVQLNTKDILFICGGAFVNLDRLVAERTSTASLGFGNPVRPIGLTKQFDDSIHNKMECTLSIPQGPVILWSLSRQQHQVCVAAMIWVAAAASACLAAHNCNTIVAVHQVRARIHSGMGAEALPDDTLQKAEHVDLIQFGLIPEFVGRFPIMCSLQVI